MKKIGYAFLTFILIILLTLTPSLFGIAQHQTPPVTEQQEKIAGNKIDGFPVIIDDKTIFIVRRGIGAFSAQERAEAITKEIKEIAKNDLLSPNQITIETDPNDNYPYLTIDGNAILSITAQDVKEYNAKPEELAKEVLEKIQLAILDYRKARRPQQLLKSVIFTLLATFAFIIISFGIIKFSGKVFPPVRNWIENRLPGIIIQNFEIVSSHKISILCLRIMQSIRLLIILTILYIYLSFVLSLFPWTKALGQSIFDYFVGAIALVFGGIIQYLPNVFIIAVIIFVTYYTIRLIKPFFTAIERETLVIPGFYPDWAQPTYNIILVLIIALAAIIAFPYLPGFNSPAFQGISVFIGILFSLGSTSAIANVVGGIILIYTRSFQVGDRIQIGDVIGDVVEKTLLVVRVRTPTNKIITIPNSSLLSSNVINFSVSFREFKNPLILQTTITLGYDLPWRKVHDTLTKAAIETQYILKEPAPFVLQTSLDDFYVSYQLNAYTDKPSWMMIIYSQLHQNIQDKCNEVGIEIMSPHYSTLRDGNQTTIPENYLPSDYVAPPFRVQALNNGEGKS
ncbi:MscS Mechanosensitive ion channel [Gloeothece citriformis PCC 7424]|uniref:MscS Mechanosensitive ion channel n=1 Tax=Gloeothece citriformis (strain PCC 7424) TaxID=65393 RepID=B7KDF2_GLOC7|nr:mechanosensitive ion channel family protein [Gloeothece citriformis]ACK68972.1 MscS Mechanosensitive ion channel [Gloeothece citriformis PCC 7424]